MVSVFVALSSSIDGNGIAFQIRDTKIRESSGFFAGLADKFNEASRHLVALYRAYLLPDKFRDRCRRMVIGIEVDPDYSSSAELPGRFGAAMQIMQLPKFSSSSVRVSVSPFSHSKNKDDSGSGGPIVLHG